MASKLWGDQQDARCKTVINCRAVEETGLLMVVISAHVAVCCLNHLMDYCENAVTFMCKIWSTDCAQHGAAVMPAK